MKLINYGKFLWTFLKIAVDFKGRPTTFFPHRHQVRSLQHKQRKDIDSIDRLLKNYRCEGCRQLENNHNQNDANISSPTSTTLTIRNPADTTDVISMTPETTTSSSLAAEKKSHKVCIIIIIIVTYGKTLK